MEVIDVACWIECKRTCFFALKYLLRPCLGVETDGEVIDPFTEGMPQSVNEKSKSEPAPEEHSVASSELTESEPGDTEIQSPNANLRGIITIWR